MDDFSERQLIAFCDAIAPWRSAYKYAWGTYIAKHVDGKLAIIACRLFLSVLPKADLKGIFYAGEFQAGQFSVDLSTVLLEDAVRSVLSPDGLTISEHGTLVLPGDSNRPASLSLPVLLHPEGLSTGNRLAVLTATGAYLVNLVVQPETDWILKAAEKPYDTFHELSSDYHLGVIRGQATFEVVVPGAVQVSARSTVNSENASIGIWATEGTQNQLVRFNYRILEKDVVIARESVHGVDLIWEDFGDGSRHGLLTVPVPRGAVIHCIACYGGHAHDQRWFADPEVFLNPRHVVLSLVDSGLRQLQAFLMPDLPAKGRAADDFEVAVTWMLWALGFAPLNFGLHPKTRDAFDLVVISPGGDCLIVECTTGLLRAESKLSKLAARVAQVRKALQSAEFQHLKVVPVMITAMTRDEVTSDLAAAQELGAVVITREELEQSLTEVSKFPNADSLVASALQSLVNKPNE